MTAPAVKIVQTGVANTASVEACFRRAGVAINHATTPADIDAAHALVLPGVGTMAAGMATLNRLGLIDPIRNRLDAVRPTLAVCLGMQLLFESSDESPGVAALAHLPGHVARFAPGIRTPQFGWNKIEADPHSTLLDSGYAYFANSFRINTLPAGWRGATAHHGEPFIAAIERGPVLACQFHPELSGPFGQALVHRWLAASGVRVPEPASC